MRKRKEDYKSYNGGGLGYSQDALDALMAGKYREFSGNRQAQYRTSQEQTQQANSLPVLKGVSIPSTDAWESNFSKNKSHIDTDRARRKYAENYNQASENLQTNDENYVVKRDRYNKLMKNSRLANDIKTLAMVNYNNANQDATVSQEWADEYGAKQITGGYTKSQFIQMLGRRYDLTPKELEDMALTFHSDANKKDVANYGEQLQKIGENNQLLGSVGSLVGTLGSGIEGMYNAGVGAISNDDRYLSNMFSTTKNAPREGAKKNMKTGAGKTAYDIMMGIADMGVGAAAGSAPVILAGNTANEAQESAMNRGSSVRRSSIYGGLAGVADYITNTIGLDKAKELAVDSIKKTGVKEFLKKSAIAGLGEAKENVYQDLAQSALDAIFNGENAELALSFKNKIDNGESPSKALGEVVIEYAGQLGFSSALGFGMGSVMQAGKTALPKLPGMIADQLSDKRINAIDPSMQKIIAKAMEATKNSQDITRHNVKNNAEVPNVSQEITQPDVNSPKLEIEDADFARGVANATPDNSFSRMNALLEQANQNRAEIPQENVNTEPTRLDEINENLARIEERLGQYEDERISENPEAESYRAEIRALDQQIQDIEEQGITLNIDGQDVRLDPRSEQARLSELRVQREQARQNLERASATDVEDAVSDNVRRQLETTRDRLLQEREEITNGGENEPPTNDVPHTDNGGNIPPEGGNPESPLVTIPERTDETGMSRVVTRAAVDADILTDYNVETDPTIQEIAKYAKANNELTFDNAKKNVTENGAQLLEEYTTDRRVIDNDQDVDQAMLLLRKLTQDYRGAKDPATKDLLYNQRNLLLSRLRKAGTKWGQSIQAFAKWNDTPEGAMINSERIQDARRQSWESQNQEQVNKNNDIAEELNNIGREERITNGGGNSRNRRNPAEPTSSRLNKALALQGSDGTTQSEPRTPKTHEQHRVEVENSIRKEFGSVADNFNDNDFEYLTNLVENNVPVDIIADEIEHRLNHGEWYTIDESTPIKKATSTKLANILKNMGDDGRKAKNAKPETGYPAKSHATISQEVANTLAGEYAGLGLDTPTDVEFISVMLEEGVPSWQIEDEINHRLMTGEWYALDESIEEPKKMDSQIRRALDSLVQGEEKPEPIELSKDEIRERVRNTLENESASLGEITDEDVEYLTNLKMNGATTEELAQALNTRMATGRFAISQDTQMKVNALFDYADRLDPNSREACEAKAAAYSLLANEVVGDASPFEKFEAWRYLAMLGNPKTWIRNFVGNTMFNAVTGISNNLSAVMEASIDKSMRAFGGKGIQRTKSVLNPTKDGSLIKAAWNDAEEHRFKQLSGSKYEKGNMRDAIKGEKSVFKSRGMKNVEKVVDKGVSDYAAVRGKYSTSLAGWMKANGLDESAFDAESYYKNLQAESRIRLLTDAEKAEMSRLKETADALEKGRDYAQKQAEYATFHEDNAIAKAFSKGSRFLLNSKHKSLRALGYGLEGIVPFKKTPANILRSGLEYSPLGAIKSIAETGKLIYENTGKRKNNLADTYTKKSWWRGDESEVERSLASDVIDSWSKSLTGAGLTYLGYYLMSKGILNSSEKDEKYQDDLEGIQNYSITINGKTYTIDWAAPAVMPLLLGAEIKKIFDRNAIPDEKWYGSADELVGAINSLLDPIFETSMLQGIQNVMESAANEIKYNDDGAIGGILGSMAMNATTGYLTQALPTLLGQVTRTVDPTRRTTDTATDSNFLSGVEKQGRKLMNKIPGLSFFNTAYRDAYGRTQGNSPYDNALANFAYQTLSPAYIRDINTTKADEMARSVYNAKTIDENGNETKIRDKDVFAPWKSKVTYGGEKFTPEQMETYRKASGEASYEIRDALSKEKWFNELDGQKQTEILKSLKSVVNKVGLDANGFPQQGKEFEAYQSGGVPELLNIYRNKEANKAVQEAGISVSSNAGKEIAKEIASGNEEKAQQMIQETKDDQTLAKELGYVDKDGRIRLTDFQNLVDSAEDQSDKMRNDLPVLNELGLGHAEFHIYAHAIQEIPHVTPNEFVKQYNDMNTDTTNKLTQTEVVDYLNSHNVSDEKAQELFTAYNDGTWKRKIKKEDGKWKLYSPKK